MIWTQPLESRRISNCCNELTIAKVKSNQFLFCATFQSEPLKISFDILVMVVDEDFHDIGHGDHADNLVAFADG